MRPTSSLVTGAVIVLAAIGVGLLGPVLAPHDVTSADLGDVRPGFVPGPSLEHPLGLDSQGRDLLSRLLHAARWSLLIGLASVALATVAGVAVGGAAAIMGARIESLVMRLIDIMLALPGLLLAIALAALLGASRVSIVVALAVADIPAIARLTRGVLLAERERDYVLAAQAVGATRRRVVVAHLLPNAIAPVVVASTLGVGGNIVGAAGLAFLGLGTNDPAQPDWGTMLADGENMLQSAPQLLLFPGLAIFITVLGFNLLGEGLRDALDTKGTRRWRPRARSAGGMYARQR